MPEIRIIVLDDDPTGAQTVHGCLLVTRWDVDTLIAALTDPAPLFFILTNTRALAAEQAAAVTREACRNLRRALDELVLRGRQIYPLLVSRSDSTLRGHYPIETDVIAEELGPFDAHFLVPAFFEGGRITLDGVHYLHTAQGLTPVHETEFARDSVFAFRHSYLPDYVEEKTGGRIPAGAVERIGIQELRGDIRSRLLRMRDNTCVVIDAERQSDLDRFAGQIRQATTQGKRFLFRSAASLLTALADLPPQPVPAEAMHRFVRAGRPGVVVIGSHVRKTSEQLEGLLSAPRVVGFEVAVDRIEDDGETLRRSLLQQTWEAHAARKTVVLYTSRGERKFADSAQRLAFGDRISEFLTGLVHALPDTIGFLVGKGGITSNDLLSKGLALRWARVLGQIHAGCSVVQCPDDHPRFPRLPVVIFPGNVGGPDSLREVVWCLHGDKAVPPNPRPGVSPDAPCGAIFPSRPGESPVNTEEHRTSRPPRTSAESVRRGGPGAIHKAMVCNPSASSFSRAHCRPAPRSYGLTGE